jgi:glutamine amidotransferase
MIAIVDYGMGNLRSVSKAFEKVGFPAVVTQDSSLIEKADGLVLPGVGAFRKAMENLDHLLLTDTILSRGLDIFKGKVIRFPFSLPGVPPAKDSLKVPHMGWNSVRIKRENRALEGIQEGTHFYFVHSYFPVPDDPGIVATTTDYGGEFVSSVGKGNLFACQFHPEKSQSMGLRILQNFGRLAQP